MKKFVSILLALTLVLSSVSSVFSFSAAAESTGQTVMDDSYFLYEDNWLINGQSSAKFGSEGQQLDSGHLMFTNADYGIHAVDALPDGSGRGLFMNTAYYLCGIPLSLQKNTNYDLQFSYYVPQGTTLNSTASVLSLAGIFSQDAQDSAFAWGNKSTLAMFADVGKYTNRTSDYSLKYDYNIKSTDISCGQWYTVTLPFYSGENAKFYFGIKTQQNGKIYFKNFKVTQNYFEDLSNWKIYKNDGTGDESATALQMNYAAASQTGGISLKSYSAANLNKIKLQGIQKNTDYKVSFKYYTTLLKTGTFSSQTAYYAISKLGVFAPAAATANKFDFSANGALFYADTNPYAGRRSTDATTAISGGETVTNPISTFTEGEITADAWLNAEFCFNSGNYEDLYLMLCCGTSSEMRFDDFEITPIETKVLGDLAVYTGSSTQVGSHEGATLMAASSGMRFNETTNAEYVVSGLSAYEVHANWQYAAAPLTGLAENTDYIFSFKYMAPAIAANQINLFQEMGLFAADAENAQLGWANDGYLYRLSDNATASYQSKDGVFANRTAVTNYETAPQANTWYEVTFKFNSANFKEIYFVLKATAADMYLDDFKLQQVYNIPVTYENESVRIEGANGSVLSEEVVGNPVSFALKCSAGVTPVVAYNGKQLLPGRTGNYYIPAVIRGQAITVTTTGQTAAQTHAPGKTPEGLDLTTYNAAVYGQNFTKGNTVYQEAVMFSRSADDPTLYPDWDQTTKKLLYPVEDVISVRSNDLKTFYVKDVDYKINADGTLTWLEGSQIPLYTGRFILSAEEKQPDTPDDMYSSDTSTTKYYGLDANKTQDEQTWGLNLINDEQHEKFTVYVTYRHSKEWSGIDYGTGVEKQGADLTPLYQKAQSGEDLNILVYGASTATGAASSGRNMNYELLNDTEVDGETVYSWKEKGNGIAAPFAPTFFEQATQSFVEQNGNNNKINYYNIARGGRDAAWGARMLQERINQMNEHYGTITPDLIYIKFAGNDSATTPSSYKASMTSMVEQFRKLYPSASIVLVSGKINNERSGRVYGKCHENMFALEQVMETIAAETENCIVAKTTSVWNEIVKVKDYTDYLSNNINHANDFWAKTTAGIIAESMQKVSTDEVAARQTEIENAFTFNGTAIRAAGTNIKQALRFKTTVDENILTENALTGNVTVTEYGFVVLNKDLLNGAELTLNSTYEKNGATVTAPQKAAYNKENGTDIVFEQNGTLKTFTAALTGITEDRYSTEYAVRVYVKLSNGEVHYAGETQYMSVYQCAALAFDAEGGTYTDTAGNSWKESYATRSYLFENILNGKTVNGKTYYTAPLLEKQ